MGLYPTRRLRDKTAHLQSALQQCEVSTWNNHNNAIRQNLGKSERGLTHKRGLKSQYLTFCAISSIRFGLSGRNSGKTPETLSELFLEFPSRIRLGSPKPYNSRHLKPPEHFQNCLPLSTAWGSSFSEVVPERASQSQSRNSSSTEGISEFRKKTIEQKSSQEN